jgi:hypothetical protein
LILDGHKSHITPLFIAKCLSHKIWVVLLLAHTFHVLQPCDLGFFSRMKPAYRRKLSMACALNAYDDPKKPEFLEAYSCAREIFSTPGNVLSGWKATGIFPRDRKKALNNRYVRSNNQVRKTPKSQVALNPFLHNFDTGLSPIEFGTPKSSRDILKLAQQARDVDPIFGNPVARQLFRKIGKGLDQHIIQNATAETRSNFLQKALDRMKPKKRKRVVPVPDEEFVRMAGVLEVRRSMPGYET